MAIAPLLDTESADWSEDLYGASWPRPALQILPDQDADEPAGELEGEPGPWVSLRPAGDWVAPIDGSPSPRTVLDVAQRRSRRAAARRRRRAVVMATIAAALVAGLSLPLAFVGGAPLDAHPGINAPAASGSVYVVRPGDTLWSIASRFAQGGDPRPLARALAKETGSAAVVPGERIAIP